MYVTYISYRICLSPRPRAGKVGEQLSYSGLPLITPPFSFFFHSNPCPQQVGGVKEAQFIEEARGSQRGGDCVGQCEKYYYSLTCGNVNVTLLY